MQECVTSYYLCNVMRRNYGTRSCACWIQECVTSYYLCSVTPGNSYIRCIRRTSYINFVPLVVGPSHMRGYTLSHSVEVTHSFIQPSHARLLTYPFQPLCCIITARHEVWHASLPLRPLPAEIGLRRKGQVLAHTIHSWAWRGQYNSLLSVVDRQWLWLLKQDDICKGRTVALHDKCYRKEGG